MHSDSLCLGVCLAVFLLHTGPCSAPAAELLAPYELAELDHLSRRDTGQVGVGWSGRGACEEDVVDGYVWPAGAAAGEVVNGTCFNGAGQASRECGEDCSWGAVRCSVSAPLVDIRNSIGVIPAGLLALQYRDITRMASKPVEPLADAVLLLGLLEAALGEAGSGSLAVQFQEDCLGALSSILNASYREAAALLLAEGERLVAGSSLLRMAELLGLRGGNEITVFEDNIEMRVRNVEPPQRREPFITTTRANNSVSLPTSAVSSSVALLVLELRNMSYFLPDILPNTTGHQLVSPVVAAEVQCGDAECLLDDPAVISFQHPKALAARLRADPTLTTLCVFWEFVERDGLFPGHWSTTGCSKTLSSPAHTVCECQHLTPFALLLDTGEAEPAAVGVVGYVCVGISLAAMLVTIATYACFRSLWSMRSYIHIHLCVSLSISQLVFVAGVTPVGEGGVSPGCRVVAVLLHYFFLASFMWVLMEGVVLYVELLRAFIKHTLRYITAFTLTSYGVPLVYLVVCLLIGFLNWEEPEWGYGYQQACWLRAETHFRWTFIAPVIAIILVNVVILCCVLVTASWQYRHNSDKQSSRRKSVFHELKVATSLVVILGVVWVVWVVMATRPLLPLLYIYAIFVAVQGLLLLTLLVPLSGSVRTAFLKCTRGLLMSSKLQGTYNAPEPKPSPVQPTAAAAVKASESSQQSSYEVHSNPAVAAKYIVAGEELGPHSLGTKAASTPSDVSLWRVAARLNSDLDTLPEGDETTENNVIVTSL